MSSTLSVTIDGEVYGITLPLKFRAVKTIFPLVGRAEALIAASRESGKTDAFELASVTIEIISAALIRQYPEMTPDHIEDVISIDETQTLSEALASIMDGSGFRRSAAPGEAVTEEGEASPSTEILTD